MMQTYNSPSFVLIYNYFMFSLLAPDWAQDCCAKIEDAMPTNFSGQFDCQGEIAVTAEHSIITYAANLEDGILLFIACCYIFMFEYLPSIKQVCIYIQIYIQRCFLKIHDGQKLPASIINFINKLDNLKRHEK